MTKMPNNKVNNIHPSFLVSGDQGNVKEKNGNILISFVHDEFGDRHLNNVLCR